MHFSFSSFCSCSTTTNQFHIFPIILLLLLAIQPCSSSQQFLFNMDGPQPCPENPIRLKAHRYPQYIYSPFDEHRLYPPDTDCQFLIEVSDKSNRIHLTVLESELEEPLFTDCKDFVSIQDIEVNGTSSRKEIVRWCGQDFPAAITSASNSILVHFHSDTVIQKRGFNISFVQFEIPGCPPEWTWDTASQFCYKQFVLPHILPWADAQKECTYERANLAVFQNEQDYTFIIEKFSQTHSFPWIGYSDANMEGVFEAVDRSSPIWPENFPLKQENEGKDCVYLDWNKREKFVHYEIDDCRTRRPFLCKRRKDGTDEPVILPSGLIRHGFRDFSIDYTILIGVIILLLLALVVGCVFYQKFKERSRVMNVDLNQRLVQNQQQVGSSSSILGSKRGGVAQSKTFSGQKAAAAAALAKEKAKEKERREREQRYEQKGTVGGGGKNGGMTPKPLEPQDSSASFPMQLMHGFTRTMQQQQIETISHQQREEANQGMGQAIESSAPQSPRISLSPNQPEIVEKRENRKEEMEEEEEEERHNMGYEPDSEEEEMGRRREIGGRRRRRDENGKEEEEQYGQEGEFEERRETVKAELHQMEDEEFVQMEIIEEKNVGGGVADEMLGKFQTAPVTEHPLRPPIELMREGKMEMVDGAPNREATMFSSTGGMESGTGTGGGRMRTRRKSFDRPPPVGPLDNVSAISLDEFWQQNQK